MGLAKALDILVELRLGQKSIQLLVKGMPRGLRQARRSHQQFLLRFFAFTALGISRIRQAIK